MHTLFYNYNSLSTIDLVLLKFIFTAFISANEYTFCTHGHLKEY